MSDIPSYSIEEAREILLDQAITLDAHIYLEGRREEYVRAEDYDRPKIIQSSFRYIWSDSHRDWDWEAKEPAEDTHAEYAEYYRQRNAVCHWFHSNARIRGGFKRLPTDVDKTKWTAEDVFGNIYKGAILEWVEAKTGFTPGHSDAFLAHYRQARTRLYRCLNAEQRRACEKTANEWNGTCVPHHVQAQNFNNKFASVCRAFTTMLMKDYGIFPFVFYIGMPGHNVPAGIYEVMRKEGLAAQTFRSFTDLQKVFCAMGAYVNGNMAALYDADAKKPPPVRSAEHLKAAEYEFRRADIEGDRVYLFEDRLRDGWEDNSSHLFYQLVQFCHSAVTSSKQTPPPWKALCENPSELIASECLPAGSVRFGMSPEKTLREHRNAFIKHWFREAGYLEFRRRFVRGGALAEPAADRWHALAKYETNLTEQWLSNDRESQGRVSSVIKSPTARPLAAKYGSLGPRVPIGDGAMDASPDGADEERLPLRTVPDPDDRVLPGEFQFRPGRPSWPSPRIVPDTIYARLQWADQLLQETGGKTAETLLLGIKWLVRLPVRGRRYGRIWLLAHDGQPVANYDYDMAYFRRLDGKDRSWAVDSLPNWLTWDTDRCYLESQEEVEGLAAFLGARAWSFQHEGKTRFAGVQMAWTIALAAIIYLRALRQAEEQALPQCARWALSGGSDWQERAKGYTFPLPREDLRGVIYEFRCYLEDLALSLNIPGLPPSLLYSQHRTREAYLYSLLEGVAELRDLLRMVQLMPVKGTPTYPSLPVFCGKRLWQQPQLGIPRSAHKDQVDVEALELSISDPELFLDSHGIPRAAEAGLCALLELAMVWADVERISAGAEGLPAYIRTSTMSSPQLLQGLKSGLLKAAAAHESRLSRVIKRHPVNVDERDVAASSATLETGPDSPRVYLERFRHDPSKTLRAHMDDVETDPLLSRIQGSVVYAQQQGLRWKSNELQRRDQNALNLAAHDTIHPQKPAQPALSLPDLRDVHDDLSYLSQDNTHLSPASAAPTKKRKRTLRIEPGRPDKPRDESAKDVGRPLKRPRSSTKDVSRSSKMADRNLQRRSEPEFSIARSGSQLGVRNASVEQIPEEQESFNLDHLQGSDDDSDSSLPVTISRPKAPITRQVGDGGEREQRALPTGSDRIRDGVLVDVSVAAMANVGSDGPQTIAEVPSPLHEPTLRPRPRRKEPGYDSQPGISTGFLY